MSNVVSFPRRVAQIQAPGHRSTSEFIRRATAFDDLTAALVMERHRRGELEPGVVEALLAVVGLQVRT